MEELTQSLDRFFQYVQDTWVTCLIIAAPALVVSALLVLRQVRAEYKESQRIKEQQGDDDR